MSTYLHTTKCTVCTVHMQHKLCGMYKQWVTFLPASLVDDILIVEKFSIKKWIVYSNETKLTMIINHTILCTPSMMSFCLKLYKSRFIHEIWCFLILFTFCLKGQGCLQTCSVTRYLCVGHPFAYRLIIFRSTNYFANSAKIWQLIFHWIVHLFTNFSINCFKFKT